MSRRNFLRGVMASIPTGIGIIPLYGTAFAQQNTPQPNNEEKLEGMNIYGGIALAAIDKKTIIAPNHCTDQEDIRFVNRRTNRRFSPREYQEIVGKDLAVFSLGKEQKIIDPFQISRRKANSRESYFLQMPGNPLTYEVKVTKEKFEYTDREQTTPYEFNFLELVDSSKHPFFEGNTIKRGNSGSPIVNQDGELVAVLSGFMPVEYKGDKKQRAFATTLEDLI